MAETTLDGDERRLEVRLNERVRVSVEVTAAALGEPDGAEVVECEALDFSANGIQVQLNQALLVGSILPLYVEAEDGQRFTLIAEVRWVKNVAEGIYQIGFLLFESEETSIIEWKQFLVRILGN